jgi:hypothetical protein
MDEKKEEFKKPVCDLIPIGIFHKDKDLTFKVDLHTAGILDKLPAGDFILFASNMEDIG